MKKKLILVGMQRNSAGFAFFNIVIDSLSRESIDITYIDHDRWRFKTNHTEVWFVDDYYAKYFLDGVRPDAIFGSLYPELHNRALPHTLISCRDHIGLVDYIWNVERYAKDFMRRLRNPIFSAISLFVRAHNVPAMLHRDIKDGDEYRLIIQHLYKSDTSIHIIWDEVKNVSELIDAVTGELKKWVDTDGLRATTFIDEMSMYPCDLSDKRLFITMPPRHGKSLYKLMMNSVYGAHPDQMTIYAALGRQNGKTQWVQKVFDEALKNGVIETSLSRKPPELTREDLDRILKQSTVNEPYLVQQQIYKSLVKGEIEMTMANMVERLERSGFEVRKSYIPTDNEYLFIISKYDFHTSMLFVYPANDTPEQRDKKQEAFIHSIITLWNRKYEQHRREHKARLYIDTDIARANAFWEEIADRRPNTPYNIGFGVSGQKLPGIKTVHFNGPVTVVIWEDKTKTIVRCKDGDEVDYEKGLAMAIAKKALGTNKSGSNYYDIFKKWLPKPEAEEKAEE